jgi:hypothetical protein
MAIRLLKIQLDEMLIKADADDLEILKEEVANKIMDLIERDELEFSVIDEEEDMEMEF